MIQHIVIVGLIGYVLTTLLLHTDGPLDIFLRFRVYVGLDLPVMGVEPVTYVRDGNPTSFVAKLLACYWCTTTWMCLVTAVGYILLGNAPWMKLVFIWLASIGISSLAYTLYTRGGHE